MAESPRDKFEQAVDAVEELEDADVRAALLGFADALDPEDHHVELPEYSRATRRIEGHRSLANTTGANYLNALRLAHERGLDLLGVDAAGFNDFMDDLTSDPERRRYGVVAEGVASIGKPYAKTFQIAAIAFYRFATEPGVRDAGDRPDVGVEWPADGIRIYRAEPDSKGGEEAMPSEAEVDAMRMACIEGQNTLRDRAFFEMAAGTGQRVYALVTLLAGDVHLDGTERRPYPHVLLNPAIDGDGDKGAIEYAGRLRPFVADTGPVREWIRNHPLRDPEVRERVGAPESFDDCYLFVGDLDHHRTDPTDHWDDEAARDMLVRRKADTASMHGVATVECPVNPHNWRSYAYTKSKELPIDESYRRKVFGWAPGSDTGEKDYDNTGTAEAAARFAEAWAEAYGDGDAEALTVAEQVVGTLVAGDLSPEERRRIVSDIIADDEALSRLGRAALAAVE